MYEQRKKVIENKGMKTMHKSRVPPMGHLLTDFWVCHLAGERGWQDERLTFKDVVGRKLCYKTRMQVDFHNEIE